jgi:peptidyl-prolyl cis-trans isomerase SurA
MRTKLDMNKSVQLALFFIMIISNQSFSYEDRIIAIINDNVILQSELTEKLDSMRVENMSKLQFAKLKKDTLDRLIEESLLEQAANRLGINISDIDLRNTVKQIAQRQNLTVLQLKDAVEAQNIDYLKYLDNLKKKVQIQELFRTQFTNRAYISEEEIKSYIKKNNVIDDLNIKLNLIEYLIEDEGKKIDMAKINILVSSIKENGYNDTQKRYPNYEIIVNNMENINLKNLPDIYQSNLKILDSKMFSKSFRTGRGHVLLKINNTDLLTEEFKVSHILMATNPMEDSNDVKNKLYEIKTQIIKNNDFSSYARKYSLDTSSAIKGGSLGWIEKKIVVPEFGSIMTNLKIGEISEPFKTQYGWHILRLEDKRIKNITDNVIRNKAINILKERKVQVAKKEWLTKLKDQAYIEIIE